MIKRIFLLLFVVLSCQNNSYHIAKHTKHQEGVAVGNYVPNFKASNPENKTVSLEDAMGKATIIDFWASWCRPCREAANPAYKKLYDKFHERGFNVIGVSSDRHQYFWRKALQQDSLPWTQVMDSTQNLLKLYQVKSIPAMFLIDRNGKIVGKNLWGTDLERKIDSLLR